MFLSLKFFLQVVTRSDLFQFVRHVNRFHEEVVAGSNFKAFKYSDSANLMKYSATIGSFKLKMKVIEAHLAGECYKKLATI